MAKKSPIATIKNVATGAIEAPVVLAGKAVGQVAKAAGTVTSLVPGRKSKPAGVPEVDRGGPVAKPDTTQRKVAGDPLKATTPAAQKAPTKKPAAKKAPAQKAPAQKAPAQKAPAQKAPAQKAPAQKAPAQKAPAKKPAPTAPTSSTQTTPAGKLSAKDAPGSKLPAKKAPAKKSPAKKEASPTPKPVNVVEKLDLDPAPVETPSQETDTEAVTSIDARAKDTPVSATPADIAAVVEKPNQP